MDAKWLDFPVQWVEAKAGDDPGLVEGYASVFGNVDLQDEIVERGAFRKTLAEWKGQGGGVRRPIPLTLEHDNTADGIIGSLVDAEEDARGLKIVARFSTVGKAQDIRTKMREGHLTGFSIFGPVHRIAKANSGGRVVTVLKELGLWFVGVTALPANSLALSTAVKGGDTPNPLPPNTATPAGLDEAQWEADMRAALGITTPTVRKAAVDALLAARRPTPVPRPPAGKAATATAEPATATPAPGATNTDAADNPSAYALSIIGQQSAPGESPPGGTPSTPYSPADLLASMDAQAAFADLEKLEAEIQALGQ